MDLLCASYNYSRASRIFIYTYLTISVLISVCRCGPDEDRLLKKLFDEQEYKVISRPVKNDSDAVLVTFQGEIQQILNLDEKTEALHVSLWLHFRWKDHRLTWNASDYGGLYSLNLPCDTIWLPDIIMYNTVMEDVDKRMMTHIVVESDGQVIWIPPGIFYSSCPVNIAWFPFDTQTCDMKFGSWTYGSLFLNLTSDGDYMNNSTYRINGEWDLIEARSKVNTLIYECCPYPFIDVTFTIVIRRRASYYILNLIVPCAFITILSLFNFIQPPEGGEKIGLGITILLSLSVFQLIVAEMIPTTSTAVPVIAAHFCAVMALCTLSLIMTILALKFHHTRPNLHRMPEWVRVGICEWLAWCLRMNRPGKPISRKYILKSLKEHRLRIKKPKPERNSCSNVELLAFNTIDDDKRGTYLSEAEQMKLVPPDKLEDLPPVDAVADKSEVVQGLDSLRREMRAVLSELRILTQKIEEDNIEEDEANQWQYAALVIDRLCFWVCTVLFSVGTLGLFFIAHFS